MPEYFAASSQSKDPPVALRSAVERVTGRSWVRATVPQTGLTAAYRYLVELADETRVFVKAAMTGETAALLLNERLAISVAPEGMAPDVLGWLDDWNAGFPMLVAKALDGHWPAGHAGVSWRPGDIAQVMEALARLASLPAPEGIPAADSAPTTYWQSIAGAPGRFHDLGLCSARWLEANLAQLIAAEERLDRRGTAFVHGDMRGDNICLMPAGPAFVDWGNARAGAGLTDLAEFLPVVHIEGGPAPQAILPEAGDWAAALAGNYAVRAIDDATAPEWLRRIFRRLAGVCLDWASHSLDLPSRGA